MTISIKTILIKSIQTTTDRLDAELLLAKVLHVARVYLHTHPEYPLKPAELTAFQQLWQRRCQGEPVAYILQQAAFWNLDFKVTPATLIPRPETELLIEIVLQKFTAAAALKIADLGTGAGAIALTLAHERPQWRITATDKSAAALAIASENAQRLGLENVSFYQGDWCQALPKQLFDIIISNPPYIPEHDPHLKQLAFEPVSALVSGADGLDAIRLIVQQARDFLRPHGLLLLEHGYDQAASVRELLTAAGYDRVTTYRDLNGHERVSEGSIAPYPKIE